MRTFWTLNKLTAPWSVCHNLELVVLDSNLVRRKENQRPILMPTSPWTSGTKRRATNYLLLNHGQHYVFKSYSHLPMCRNLMTVAVMIMGYIRTECWMQASRHLQTVSYSVFGDWFYQSGAGDLSWRSCL